jgi:hypothetical protein
VQEIKYSAKKWNTVQEIKYSAKSENNTKNPNITSDKFSNKIVYIKMIDFACDLYAWTWLHNFFKYIINK